MSFRLLLVYIISFVPCLLSWYVIFVPKRKRKYLKGYIYSDFVKENNSGKDRKIRIGLYIFCIIGEKIAIILAGFFCGFYWFLLIFVDMIYLLDDGLTHVTGTVVLSETDRAYRSSTNKFSIVDLKTGEVHEDLSLWMAGTLLEGMIVEVVYLPNLREVDVLSYTNPETNESAPSIVLFVRNNWILIAAYASIIVSYRKIKLKKRKRRKRKFKETKASESKQNVSSKLSEDTTEHT